MHIVRSVHKYNMKPLPGSQLPRMQEDSFLYEAVPWYKELQDIRERLSIEEDYLEEIKEFTTRYYCSSGSEVPGYDLLKMIRTLLLSYPVLAKRHLNEWESFRKLLCGVFESDKERSMELLEMCLAAVTNDNAIEAIKYADDPDTKAFYQPFDCLDKVKTLRENKDLMPFKLLEYDDARLERIVKTIQEINIRKWIAAWLKDRPSVVYPEVAELYKNHSKDENWFP